MTNERQNDLGRNGRKHWIQRYMGLLACSILLIAGFTTSLVNTWANANKALAQATENEVELDKREPAVSSIPHIASKLDDHILEQRNFNTDLKEQINYLVRNTKKVT